MIVGSLIFMVAGFIFLMLGRGSEPNAFQFLSIAASLAAGTLLVMGYLKERKRRPARAEASADSAEAPAVTADAPGEQSRPRTDGRFDVEADLKALEDGTDEEELQPAGSDLSEPLVSSVTSRKISKRKAAGQTRAPVREPAMAGAVSGPAIIGSSHTGDVPGPPAAAEPPRSASGGDQPVGASSASARGSQESSPTGAQGGAMEPPTHGAADTDQFATASSRAGAETPEDSGASAPPLAAANRQWAELISDVDNQKFEPPAFEKPQTKSKGVDQEPRTKEALKKEKGEVTQAGAVASKREGTSDPQKPRRGLFGLFKRKSPQSPAGAGEASSAGGTPTAGAEEQQGTAPAGRDADPADNSPQAAANELSAAQREAAEEAGAHPGEGGPVSRPETAPVGEQLEAVAAAAGGGPPPVKAKTRGRPKTAGKAKTAAKPKSAAGKPRTAKPKASAKTPTSAAKTKAVGRATSPSKAKAPGPVKPSTSRTAKTGKSAKTAAKPKSTTRRKTTGSTEGG